MRRQSGEQGARASAAKARFRQAASWAKSRHAEFREQEGMVRHAERRQNVVAEARPGGGERLGERSPGFAVGAQIRRGARDGKLQDYGGTAHAREGAGGGGVVPVRGAVPKGGIFRGGGGTA